MRIDTLLSVLVLLIRRQVAVLQPTPTNRVNRVDNPDKSQQT